MKRIIFRCVRPVITACLLYIAAALVLSTIAFIRLPKASGEALPQAPALPAAADTGKKDRAALVETRKDAWNARMALIGAAEESLDIVYHSVQADTCGQAFWGEVLHAADRGVKVRVLLDGKVGASSRQAKKTMRALAAHPRIACRRFNPAHPLRPWQWHALLHDKFIIMDGRYVLLGGRNIGDRYYGPAGYKGALVEDRDVLAAGSVLDAMKAYMTLLWEHEASVPYRAAKGPAERTYAALHGRAAELRALHPAWYEKTLRDFEAGMVEAARIVLLHNPVHTGQKEPVIGKALHALGQRSRRSVLIQTPYMTGNQAFLDAIAQVNGQAPVSIQTNALAVSPNSIAFSNYHANRQAFADASANIYEYHGPGSIHGKSAVFDGRLSAVGSLNLDDRSVYIDTESMLLIDSPAFARQLTAEIEALSAQSFRADGDGTCDSGAPAGKRAAIRVLSWLTRPVRFLI